MRILEMRSTINVFIGPFEVGCKQVIPCCHGGISFDADLRSYGPKGYELH